MSGDDWTADWTADDGIRTPDAVRWDASRRHINQAAATTTRADDDE